MNIYYIQGDSETPLATLANSLSEPPILIWLEPRPVLIEGQIGLTKAKVFQGLQIPSKTAQWFEQCLPKGVIVEQARFYWQHSALHLLAKEQEHSVAKEQEPGCRYFAYGEDKSFLNHLKLGKVEQKDIVPRQQNPIYLRHDLAYFGLENLGVNFEKLQVISYWDENSLWAWRLEPITNKVGIKQWFKRKLDTRVK